MRRVLISSAAGVAITIALAWMATFLPRGNAWHGPRTLEDLGVWEAGDRTLWSMGRGRNAWHTVVTYWRVQVSGRSLRIPTADYDARKFDDHRLPRRLRPGSLSELNMNAWFHQRGGPQGVAGAAGPLPRVRVPSGRAGLISASCPECGRACSP